MFKSEIQRGCQTTSPFFRLSTTAIALILLVLLSQSCNNEKPLIQECRIWHVFSQDPSRQEWIESIAVQVRLNPGFEAKKVKELGIYSSQKEIYWVGTSSDLHFLTLQDQIWLVMKNLAIPAFESIPLGKFDVVLETYDGDQARGMVELPVSSFRRPGYSGLVQNRRIEPLPPGLNGFREIALLDSKGVEANRFVLKGAMDISGFQGLANTQVSSVMIEDFYPQDGVMVISGPWPF